jgi:hypothetical protein
MCYEVVKLGVVILELQARRENVPSSCNFFLNQYACNIVTYYISAYITKYKIKSNFSLV